MTLKEKVLRRLLNQPDPTNPKTQWDVFTHFQGFISYDMFREVLTEIRIFIPSNIGHFRGRANNVSRQKQAA